MPQKGPAEGEREVAAAGGVWSRCEGQRVLRLLLTTVRALAWFKYDTEGGELGEPGGCLLRLVASRSSVRVHLPLLDSRQRGNWN